jgi:hypothetical protein
MLIFLSSASNELDIQRAVNILRKAKLIARTARWFVVPVKSKVAWSFWSMTATPLRQWIY